MATILRTWSNAAIAVLAWMPSACLGIDGYPIQLRLTDAVESDNEHQAEEFHLSDHPQPAAARIYPSQTCYGSGRPHKPIMARPGDITRKDCPPERYSVPDFQRAGNPQSVAWWAKCSVTKNNSAWFVGGDSSWIHPFKKRNRSVEEEGTWGLDYDGLFGPRRVWLGWSTNRTQGGIGAYRTDGEPAILAQAKEHLKR